MVKGDSYRDCEWFSWLVHKKQGSKLTKKSGHIKRGQEQTNVYMLSLYMHICIQKLCSNTYTSDTLNRQKVLLDHLSGIGPRESGCILSRNEKEQCNKNVMHLRKEPIEINNVLPIDI